MAVTTTTSRVSYSGDGTTTVFPVPFYFLANPDLNVYVGGAEFTTGYTVTGAGDEAGGSVEITPAPGVGAQVVIIRNPDLLQQTRLPPNDPFPSTSVEDMIDKLTMIVQRHGDLLGRVPVLADSDVDGAGAYHANQNRMQDLGDPVNSQDAVNLRTMQSAVADLVSTGGGDIVLALLANNVDPTLGAALIGFDGGTLANFFLSKNNRVVDSIAALRALTKTTYTRAFVTGYYAAGDGGGAPYWYDPTDTTSADNGGTIIVASDGGRWKLANIDVITVKQFGAKGDGTTDDTAAIQNTINAFPSGNCRIRFPKGVYKVTSAITVANGRTHLEGDGIFATQILFVPTANGVCFQFTAGASVLYQTSLRDMTFYSNDSTYSKVAIDLVDTSQFVLDNVSISGSIAVNGSVFWSGSSSIGLRVRGRELGNIKNFTAFCDLPIVIGPNPNFAAISIDHFHFQDLYIGANGNPKVTIQTGVNLTNVLFDGRQAWVLGTDGLSWVDTSTTSTSAGLTIKNVRCEQETSSTAHAINIQHNFGLQRLVLDNCYWGLNTQGILLRKVSQVDIRDHFHVGGTTMALDVDSTVGQIILANVFTQTGSTASLGSHRSLFGTPPPASAPLPVNAVYDLNTNTFRNISIGGAISEDYVQIGNGGTFVIGDNGMRGTLIVTDSEGLSAGYSIRGTNNSTLEAWDPSGVFSPTAGTASMTNIYWDAGTSKYTIQNLRGAVRNYKFTLLGSYSSF